MRERCKDLTSVCTVHSNGHPSPKKIFTHFLTWGKSNALDLTTSLRGDLLRRPLAGCPQTPPPHPPYKHGASGEP